jgi:hypothetical protein
VRHDVFDEYLGELVDPVVNEHVARTGDGRRLMRHFVDRCTHCMWRAFREHPRNTRRRSDLSRKTLHENCPNHRRLNAFSQTIDCFGFQTRAAAHVVAELSW